MSEKLNPNFKRVIMTGSMVLSIAYLLHQLTAKIRLPGRYLEDYYKRADELLKEYYNKSPTALKPIPESTDETLNKYTPVPDLPPGCSLSTDGRTVYTPDGPVAIAKFV